MWSTKIIPMHENKGLIIIIFMPLHLYIWF